MKPAPFDYHAPATLEEAVGLLDELGEGARVLAGGQSLVPLMALRLAVFDHLVDLGGVQELRGIERRNGTVRIGAGTTQAAIEHSADVRDAAPLWWQATPLIGHFQIRNRGTVGGSLAHADPAAEYPAVALTLDAELEAVSLRGRRTILASEFFAATFTTALADDEILAAVSVPVWGPRAGFAVEEMARRHGDFAIAGAAVGVELDESGAIARAAIGLIGMGSTPIRATAAEAAVTGVAVGELEAAEIGRMACADLHAVPSDLHGSDAYRISIAATMVERAWRRAVGEADDA